MLQEVPRQESLSDTAKRVVILGGGFAGMATAKALCRNLSSHVKKLGKVEVLVVNANNYHLFTPLLYQMSTGLVDNNAIAIPIRRVGRSSGFEFLEAMVTSINVQARAVYTHLGYLPYDYLVVALGTVKDDEKVKGATEYAIPLKTLEDGKKIHNRIVTSFEKAASLENGTERDAYLSFVVIGGSTGSELAGSLVDYVKAVAKEYGTIDALKECKVHIVEAKDSLFPGGDETLSDVVKQSLEKRGVKVLTHTRVEEIDHERVRLSNGETLHSYNVFDNSGVKPNPIIETMPDDVVKKDRGRIAVDDYLRLPGFNNVFALGDNAAVKIGEQNGKAAHAPPTAESAVEEGKFVGKLLARQLNSELSQFNSKNARTLEPFNYKAKGTMISIGSRQGVAKFRRATFTGILGWLIWRVVHLYLISTVQSKMTVTYDWVLDLFGKINTAEIP